MLSLRPEMGFGKDELLAMGKLGRTWGVRGAIILRLYNVDSDLAWAGDVAWLAGEGFPHAAVDIEWWDDKGGKLLVKFVGVDSKEDVSALTHLEVLVPRESLPEIEDADEAYIHQLIGLKVVDEVKGELGTIAEVFNAGATDVWVVRGPHGEVMIPAIKDFVRSVDLAEGTATVLYDEM